MNGEIWLEVILRKVHCIDKVLTFSFDGQPRVNWDCTDTDCDNCESPNSNKCNDMTLILSAPADPTRIPISNDCKYGDRARIKRKGANSSQMWISEIAIIEGEGKILSCKFCQQDA